MASPPHRGPNKPRQKSVKGDTVTGSKWVGNNWEALAEAAESNASTFETQSVETIIRDDGWVLEAWRRLDPRISYEDIIDRMTADPEFCQGKGLSIPSKNSLQMHTLRSCRKLLGYWQLEGRKNEPSRAMVEAIEKLTPNNLLYNTVLPIFENDTNRLVKLKFERKTEDGQFKAVPLVVTPDNINKVTLPLNFFCQPLQDNASTVGVSVDRAWETLLVLQERADIHGLSHWSKLHKNCRPISWQTRTKGAIPDNRPDDDKDGDDRTRAHTDTYDGGCSVCTWRPKSEGAGRAEKDHSFKRQRADESDEEPVARRLRTETYGIDLAGLSSGTSEINGLAQSSPSGYSSVRGQDHGYLHPPSTPLRYGGTKMIQPFNSSPPGYYSAATPASQTAISYMHAAQGMTAGSRMTPMSPRSGLPRINTNLMNVGSAPASMQPHQAHPWTVHEQFGLAHDDFHHTMPSMLHAFPSFGQSSPDISTDTGLEQKPVKSEYHLASRQSWQHLPDVQCRTMDLQNALGTPYSHDIQRYGPSEVSHNYYHSVWDRSNRHPMSLVPTPALYASKSHSRQEISPHVEHVQYDDPMFTGPATPQHPYEPSLSDSGHTSFGDNSSQDTLPNMDWNDDVFRFMLHSDEANEPPKKVVNILSSLADDASVKEFGSPLSMHAAKHDTVDHAEDHQFSHEESVSNQGFLDQLQT
ncbi:hypothetical protein DV736_g6265, partial [Chaetothyriales sp. CBS 134916]